MTDHHKQNIKNIVLWGFGLITLLFIFVGIVSFIETRSLVALTTKIYDHPLKVSNSALRALAGTTKMHRLMKDVFLAEDSVALEKTVNLVTEEEKAVLSQLDMVRALIIGSEGRELEKETRNQFLAWRPIRQEVLQLIKNGNLELANQVSKEKCAVHSSFLEKQMLKLTAYAHDIADGFVNETLQIGKRFYLFIEITVIVGAFLVIIIAFYTSRQILVSFERRKKAEQRLDSFINEAPIGMLIASSEGQISRVNNAFCNMLGYTEKQLLNMTDEELTHPDDIHIVNDYLKLFSRGEIKSFEAEKRYLHINGRVVWGLLKIVFNRRKTNNESYYIAQIQDITEAKQNREALKINAERLAMAQEVANIGSWDWHIAENKLYWSDKTYRQFGLEPGEIEPTYEAFEKFVHPEDLPFVNQEVDNALKLDKTYSIDARIIRKDGREWVMNAQGKVFRDKDNKPVRFVGTQLDITERKKMEAMQTSLLIQSHEAGMAEMASEVLHNIGNAITPAHILVGSLAKELRASLFQKDFAIVLDEFRDLFAASPSVPEEEKDRLAEIATKLPEAILEDFNKYLEMLGKINTKHEHIMKIIALQSGYAYLPGTFVEVSLNNVLDDALDMLDESLRKYQIQVFKEYGELLNIKVEKSKLIQVLVNLIKNCQEATYDNSLEDRKLTIATSLNAETPAFVSCSIKDNGSGFTEEQKKHLFDFGFTTKKTGFGFGLHSCANYLAACGGSIQAHSDGPGLGAQFTISLPVSS